MCIRGASAVHVGELYPETRPSAESLAPRKHETEPCIWSFLWPYATPSSSSVASQLVAVQDVMTHDWTNNGCTYGRTLVYKEKVSRAWLSPLAPTRFSLFGPGILRGSRTTVLGQQKVRQSSVGDWPNCLMALVKSKDLTLPIPRLNSCLPERPHPRGTIRHGAKNGALLQVEQGTRPFWPYR